MAQICLIICTKALYKAAKTFSFLLTLISIVHVNINVNAQVQPVIGLPTQWGQYLQTLPLINPSSAGKNASVEINTGNLRHLGLWKNNQTYFIESSIRLGEISKNGSANRNFHTVGFYLLGEDEGQYLHRIRGYGMYNYHLQIRENLHLSAGVSLGFMSYTISANDYTSGASSTTFDGNLGVSMYSDKFYFGISANQFNQGKVTPIQETTILERNWNFTGYWDFSTSPYFKVRPNFLLRYAENVPIGLNLGMLTILSQKLGLGVTYRNQEIVALMIGLEKLPFGNSSIKAYVSYNIPLPSYTSVAFQSIEITLGYELIKKSKSSFDIQPDEQ